MHRENADFRLLNSVQNPASDLLKRGGDVVRMSGGMLDLPQPRLAVGCVMDDEVFPSVLPTDLFLVPIYGIRPRPQLNRHSVGFRDITDRRTGIHGLKVRS